MSGVFKIMRGKFQTRIKDRGYKKIVNELEKSHNATVTIGIHEGAGTYDKSDVKIVQVAFWNEYGTSKIPSRPFIRSTIDAKGRIFRKLTKSLWGDVVSLKKTTETALGALGTRIAIEIQGQILNSIAWAAPNSPSTTLKKSFGRGWMARPLIDSGTLLRSIGWQSKTNGIKSKVTKNPKGK